jgi:hypothetical protein
MRRNPIHGTPSNYFVLFCSEHNGEKQIIDILFDPFPASRLEILVMVLWVCADFTRNFSSTEAIRGFMYVSTFQQDCPEGGKWGNLPQAPATEGPRPTAFLYLIFIIIWHVSAVFCKFHFPRPPESYGRQCISGYTIFHRTDNMGRLLLPKLNSQAWRTLAIRLY